MTGGSSDLRDGFVPTRCPGPTSSNTKSWPSDSQNPKQGERCGCTAGLLTAALLRRVASGMVGMRTGPGHSVCQGSSAKARFSEGSLGYLVAHGSLGVSGETSKGRFNTFVRKQMKLLFRRHSLVSILVFCQFKMCDYMVSCVSVLYVCSVECVCVHVCEFMCL